MTDSTSGFGPTAKELNNWSPRYIGNTTRGHVAPDRTSLKRGVASGVLASTPLVFGSADEYHDFNLDYYKVVRQEYFNKSGAYPTYLADYKDPYTDNPRPYFYRTSYSSDSNARERNVKTRTFAGRVSDLSYEVDFQSARQPARPNSKAVSTTVLESVIDQVNGAGKDKGIFSALIPGAPNGFLISEAYDYDVQWPGDDVDDDTEKARLLSSYWPERLGNDHPLRDLYEKFYGPGARFWQGGKDRSGTAINTGTTLAVNNALTSTQRTHYNYKFENDPVIAVTGPLSHTDITLGNGNNIIAASPVMTAALHRTIRPSWSGIYRRVYADFHADTVLYPSSVGQHLSNTLTAGDGNNLIYYDSSFSDITAGRGNNIFLPSFGAFNWAIDWIPAYGALIDSPSPWGSTSNLNANWLIKDESGRPLISPIPWDSIIVNPRTGKQQAITDSYLKRNSDFAATQQRGSINNLYTINSYNKQGSSFQRTYLNNERLNDNDNASALKTYNPVNQLGGTRIKANGGNNIFYGLDWSFWKHLLPTVGTTTANQPAQGDYKRAAQHRWKTTTFMGGRGSNTFNLGNVIDHITDNGLFYDGDASYQLSLTHDRIYSNRYDIRNLGSSFGNATDLVTGSPLMSLINLQLQADPETIALSIQNADPGQEGANGAERAGAWNGVANSASQLVGNTAKINEDFAKRIGGDQKLSWLSTSKTLATLVGSALPFMDTAIAITNAVIGLVNLFSAKPAKPPKQEIKITYQKQDLDPARKAILINDWHPSTRININIPSVDASQWNNLTFEVKEPGSGVSSRNTQLGTYLNLRKHDNVNNKTLDFPLVVLQNVDFKETKNSNPLDTGFGYFSYSFIDPDGAGELSSGFKPISTSNLKLFGQLPNPAKLQAEDGSALGATFFPATLQNGTPYIYTSNENFDMRYDAANYQAFFGQNGAQQEGSNSFYSRYYFDATSINTSDLPASWSINSNLRQFTSNISLEFDSRTLGWYWMPVLQTPRNADGSLDITRTYNADQQSLDFDRSKLWLQDPKTGSWSATSYSDLNYITQAFRAAQKATTFYTSSFQGEARAEINRRQQRDQQLELLNSVMPDLRTLDQTYVRDERSRIYFLSQIVSVSTQSAYAEGRDRDGLAITFTSVDEQDNEQQKQLLLYKNDAGIIKAASIDALTRDWVERITPLETLVGRNFSNSLPDTSPLSGGSEANAFPTGKELRASDQVVAIQFNGDPKHVGATIDLTYTVEGSRYLAHLVFKRDNEFPFFPPVYSWFLSYRGPLGTATALQALERPTSNAMAWNSDALVGSSDAHSVMQDGTEPWQPLRSTLSTLPWVEQPVSSLV